MIPFRAGCFLFLFITLLSLSSCKEPDINPLTGVWTYTAFFNNKNGYYDVIDTIVLKKDRTCTYTHEIPQKPEESYNKSGTYELKGEKLTLTFADGTFKWLIYSNNELTLGVNPACIFSFSGKFD